MKNILSSVSAFFLFVTWSSYSVGGCLSQPFGVASQFNLFVLNELIQENSDTEGRVAVGGNATLSHYSVGERLASGLMNKPYALVVGNTLRGQHGRVSGGPVAYGISFPYNESFTLMEGAKKTYPIVFSEVANLLWQRSQDLASLPAPGSVIATNGALTLQGESSELNTFSISADQLAQASYLRLSVPSESTVVINVRGKNVQWLNYGFDWKAQAGPRILFHFPEARQLSLRNLAVPGSVLAPLAVVDFNEGRIDGQLIAYSMHGNGQMNLLPFAGCITQFPR